MNAIGPELPLNRDNKFGNFSLLTTYKDQIQQNFKNLLLTSPGERVMNPDFGVGLRTFLFEPREYSASKIRQRIASQVSKYMPFIEIDRISFDDKKTRKEAESSYMLSVSIQYRVPSINVLASIEIDGEGVV